MLEYVFFDLDGTLTDPALGITNCIMHSLEKMGREIPPRESLYCFIGPPLLDSYRNYLGMTEEEAREAIRLYRERFSTVGLFENTPYEGIANALAEVKSMGKKLCIATSKPEEFAVRILEHFDLSKYFDMVCDSMVRMISEAYDRVPLTDWYCTKTAIHHAFQARSVTGGLYINMI